MKDTAVLFPGQGAQFVGMGKDFHDAFPEARALFDRADAALGMGLKELCFEGPAERLEDTDVCQPGILVTSLAVVEALRERGRLDRARLAAAAGLSLGEYSALVFAGALEFEDAVRLTRARGQYMLDASRRAPSGMLSLVGGTAEQAEALVERGRGRGVLVVANRNAPGQLVLSGAVAALDEAARIAPELGIRRTVRLKVSGAFHSPLMEPAAERLRADLARVTIRRPEFPVVANASARPLTDPEEIRASLAAQVASPVLFEASLRALFASGVRRFVEPAPGRVLAGLVGRTLPEVEVVGFETAAALAAA